MKIIIAGSTGYVATELIRQGLSNPSISSIIALVRRETATPGNLGPFADPSKLKSVVCDNFEEWPENIKKEVEGRMLVFGLEIPSHLPCSSPFRFIYTSGSSSERDPSKSPWILGDYLLMRAETRVLSIAARSTPPISACIARPGLIGPDQKPGLVMKALQTIGRSIIGLPALEVELMAAALLDQAIGGFEKELLENDDLARIGVKALGREG